MLKTPQFHRLSFLVFVLSMLAFSCTKTGMPLSHSDASAEPASRAGAPVKPLPHPALLPSGAASIADVTERVLPSVVNISLTKVSRVRTPFPVPFFFGPEGGGEQRQQGVGSGVIVSADGYILTNNHVVSQASEIKVTTSDTREFDASVVGTDPKSDLAVIKIKGKVTGLSPITFGDSSRLRLGDVVLAIGNPFGVGQTVTMGIVSAKGRAGLGLDYEDFIQTDAAINPGNSGGALVNMLGELVGINTAILSRTGGNQGIGFAIPTGLARPIMESLKKDGRVVRGWLGVTIQDVDQEIAQAMKLPVTSGVLISNVLAGGPAEKGGLRRGDVLTELDGTRLTSASQLRNRIASRANAKVNLELYRDAKVLKLAVTLGEMPDNEGLPGSPATPQTGVFDGVTLEDIRPEHRRMFQIPGDLQKGVVVTAIDPASPAAKAGLRQGDVLMEVNKKPVDSLQTFRGLHDKLTSKLALLLVNRRGDIFYVPIRRE